MILIFHKKKFKSGATLNWKFKKSISHINKLKFSKIWYKVRISTAGTYEYGRYSH